ncbi:MAG: hypothetical protein A2Y13_10970 [Planctomycetes bacterium GWC2_45_44]|nr:MAG: hypothetical protein A2Y13_10970 [Planctomycetes bacterium GWC2_45_44]
MFDIFEFFKGRHLTTRLILLACTAGLVAIGVMMIYASGNPAKPLEKTMPLRRRGIPRLYYNKFIQL